tara:strand:- start:989 stop:1186 length:198 start_codon:yes stop_codon:yes gene_type:complete
MDDLPESATVYKERFVDARKLGAEQAKVLLLQDFITKALEHGGDTHHEVIEILEHALQATAQEGE